MSKQVKPVINVYSDESRHLKGQGPNMVIGSVWCDSNHVQAVSDKVALIKQKHGIPTRREIKWTKVSDSKLEYYKDLVKLFFEDDDLYFRAIVVPMENLQHEAFEQSNEDFYYKMQFVMLTNIVRKRDASFKIYLDYKDSWSYSRSQHLARYLSNKVEFSARNFSSQPVRSYESSLLQLADLFIGAVGAKNNHLELGHAKTSIIYTIQDQAFQNLDAQTPAGVDKFNIFKWQPRETRK
jgi:hypothetical protein